MLAMSAIPSCTPSYMPSSQTGCSVTRSPETDPTDQFPMDMGGGSVTEQLAGVDLDDPSRLLISGANAARLYQP